MSETPTPRTDAFYDARFQNTAATWEEKFKDACDFARRLECERDEALEESRYLCRRLELENMRLSLKSRISLGV